MQGAPMRRANGGTMTCSARKVLFWCGATIGLLAAAAADTPSDIKPGLATEWHVDPANHKRWIFTLRQGVKWHDGCDFTADDVVWNFQRISDQKAPQFFTQQFALSR